MGACGRMGIASGCTPNVFYCCCGGVARAIDGVLFWFVRWLFSVAYVLCFLFACFVFVFVIA